MEIQYTLFCQDIDLRESQIVLRSPIVAINVNKLSRPNVRFRVDLPLYISFLYGLPGTHELHIDIVKDAEHIGSQDFTFDWPQGADGHLEVFELSFQPTSYGVYRFKLNVNGQPLGEIPLPVLLL